MSDGGGGGLRMCVSVCVFGRGVTNTRILTLRYYYGIRPLYVDLLVNFHIFNKGWPYSIVEGIRVGI